MLYLCKDKNTSITIMGFLVCIGQVNHAKTIKILLKWKKKIKKIVRMLDHS